MTIASALTALNQDIQNARTAITNKGGTVTANGGSSQLATDIATIPSGGSAPVIESLSVTPTTSAQTITAPSGTDGYSPVNVSAVTASIDNNIVASNIKSGVSILGVSGNVTALNGETRTATLTSSAGNTFTPSSGKNAITSITVTPNNQTRSVTPSTSSQTLSVNSGYSGNGTIMVNAVTSSIDSNITAENIKKDVSILGVIGTYEGSGGEFIGIPREIYNSTWRMPTNSFTFKLPDDVLILFNYGLAYSFITCLGLTSIDFNNLNTINLYALYYTCRACRNLTTAKFPSLTTISGAYAMQRCFYDCSALTLIGAGSLSKVSGDNALNECCRGCTSLTREGITTNLSTVSGNNVFERCFYGCTSLNNVIFMNLKTITGSNVFKECFYGCTNLENVQFWALTSTSFSNTNIFTGMMTGTGSSKTHTLHFPRNLQSTISGLDGYPLFGGTSGKVVLAFDM